MKKKARGYDGKTAFKAGLAYDKETGKGIDELVDLQAREAQCGCGIDCCERELVLTDKGNDHFMSLYFENGGAFVRDNTTNVVYELTMTPLES